MTVFAVFQPNLTDAQIEELNGPNGGWSAKPEFSAYANITTGTFRGDIETRVHGMVLDAMANQLYYHVANVEAGNLNDAWTIGNHRPQPAITELNGEMKMKSISIGDILIDVETQIGYYCNRSGWIQINAETLNDLNGMVVA